MKKEIYYWGPFIDKVATVTAILNSAQSINEYSKKFSAKIINAVGEWDEFIKEDRINNLNFINFNFNFYKNLPRFSYIKSRISYLIIFLKCFFPLKNLLNKNKPEFLIIHLIISLPLILFLIFRFETKLCLRISGKPKFNIFRLLLWKMSAKKIYKVFSPTQETKDILVEKKIFDESKIFVLKDPILKIKKIMEKKKEEKLDKKFIKNNLILVGRLTKQKNFKLFIEAFEEIQKEFPDLRANILGEGELKNELIELTKRKKLLKKIIFLNYKKNVFKYILNSKIFILPSLWEDPGFVLIEAAACNVIIISSDCESGPKEFLNHGEAGYLFKSGNKDSLVEAIKKVLKNNIDTHKIKKIAAKKQAMHYSVFRHFDTLESTLND